MWEVWRVVKIGELRKGDLILESTSSDSGLFVDSQMNKMCGGTCKYCTCADIILQNQLGQVR